MDCLGNMDDAQHAQQGFYFDPSLPAGMPVMAPIEDMTDTLEAEDASMVRNWCIFRDVY